MYGNERFPGVAKSFSAVLFFVVCFSPPLKAEVSIQKDQTTSETKNLKEVPPVAAVVSATRREIPIEKATRFVTVITREEIERSGKVYVLDLLQAQPGVTVTQSGPSGRTVNVFVRGTNSNHVIIMLDGVQLNSTTTGQAELADLTLENIILAQNIDRIEILRGPQSVLYGSDALGGVINIITKPGGKAGLHGSGRFEYGTHETFYEAGGLSSQWKKFAFSGGGARLDTEGPGENDGFQDTHGFGHGKYQVTENSDLDVAFHYYNALAGIEDGPFLQDPNAYNRSREQIVNTKYNFALVDGWEQSVKYSFFHDMLLSVDPPNPGTRETQTRFKLDTDRHTAEYQSDLHFGDVDVLTMGYEFEHSRSNNKSFDKVVRNHGWFLQNELTLWKIWTLVGGVRIDKNQISGTEASPLVSSGLWIAKTMTKIKGSFGRGFKTPTFNQLFFQSPRNPIFGNPDLLPEENWGWDAGFEQFYWNKKGNCSVAYFHNSIRNLIQNVGSGASLRAENVARATTQGVELEHKITPWKHFNLYTNYTYLNAVDGVTGKRLIRRPWHQGKAGLAYEIWKVHFSADWIFVGKREDTRSGQRAKNKGYTRLDLSLFYDVTDFFQVYGRIENATDDHYDEVLGFNNPSARFLVGTKVKL